MTLEDFKSYSEEYLASYGNMSRNTQDQKRRGVEKFIRFMESEGRQEIDQKAMLASRKACWDIPETPLRSIYPG